MFSEANSLSRDVINVWESGKETLKQTDNESQVITVEQERSSVGTKDYITGSSAGVWSAWTNDGSVKNCSAWTPDVDTVNLDSAFTQSRNCKQDQTRTRTIYNVWKSGKKTFYKVQPDAQTVDVTQSQSATGTKNYIESEKALSWKAWTNDGSPYDCSLWSPAPETVNLGQAYEQTRSCKQKQIRTRGVNDVWADGTETQNRVETDSQVITVTQNQAQTGEKDYITTTRAGAYGAWANEGGAYSCSAWSPTPGTVNLGEHFVQDRECKQNQKRTRTVYNVWKSGKETVKTTETASQTINVAQEQSATGTKDYITGSSTGAWSAWANDGSVKSCSTWSPATSTVNLGSSFTQSRTCDQAQTRTRTVYDVWASGAKTEKSTQTGTQTIEVTQSQSATGTKNYITGTSYSSWSGWSNSGGVYSCSSYSPSTSSVNLGSTFTQSRSCSQNQVRSRTVYNVWKDGSTTVKTTESDSRTVDVTQNRSATGTKDYITGTSYSSWSGWSNSGGHYSCGSWTPDPSTVNYGSSFTQNRTCKQNQTRSRTVYNVWKSGAKTTKTTESGSQTVNVTESRSATGTKNIVVGSESTTGAWSYTASASCGGWSPATSTVNYGTSFTQTQSCSRPRERTITTYNVWTNGTKTVKSTSTEAGAYTYSNSRTATGTKDYVTNYDSRSYYYSYGTWSCGSYSPDPSDFYYTVTFTQYRSCTRTKQYRYKKYWLYKSGSKVLKGDYLVSSSTESKTETQSMTGISRNICLNPGLPRYKKESLGCAGGGLEP
ncbi:MAG: hypothetical protein CL840_00065 [Crocinitomicaceae bacterium]|nr:hypothetical protein [Crocinitomicaceae bacterium]